MGGTVSLRHYDYAAREIMASCLDDLDRSSGHG
jgi:hypothetical protein